MLSEAHYEAALNYFYFLLLDEGAALQSALKTVKIVHREFGKKNFAPDSVLISVMSKVLHKVLKKPWNPIGDPPKSDWKTAHPEILASWKDYLRSGDMDSAEAIVLRYVLGYEVKTIVEGLSVPEGTFYFRLGRGLESFAGVR
jgi:DNA-directed RNA polymerase specialized sigma24 family protein